MKNLVRVCVLLVVCLMLANAAIPAAATHQTKISREYATQKALRGHHARHGLDDANICNSLVCVQTDEDGDFNIGTSDGRTLLYDYPDDPWSTDIRISIDGSQYNLTNEAGSDCAGFATFVSESHDATHITDNYTLLTGFAVTVTHTLTVFSDSSAAVLTRTVVTNNTGATHNIGVLYEYDTMVDDDDAATLYLGPNHITVETCYTAPFPYPYWDAIPYTGSLVGRGTFTGGDAVTPDALAFGQWGSLDEACWAYDCTGEDYGDSAVLYRWNEQPVANGQNRTVATYYGVSGINSAAGALRITVSQPNLSCQYGQVVPNPFQILVSVFDTTNTACNTVSVHMSDGAGTGGYAQITGDNPQTVDVIENGGYATVPFTAQLTPLPGGGVLAFQVQVTSDNCGQNALPFSVDVPACSQAADPQPNSGMVSHYALRQNYPNPFNPTTTIGFDLLHGGVVSLQVFNITGQEVAAPVNGFLAQGSHEVSFNASGLPSGIYLCRLTVNGFVEEKKMLMMK